MRIRKRLARYHTREREETQRFGNGFPLQRLSSDVAICSLRRRMSPAKRMNIGMVESSQPNRQNVPIA